MRISDWSSDVCSSDLVTVDGDTLGAIGRGLLALVGVEPGDGDAQVERMTQRLLGYRSEERRVGKEWVSTCSSRWSLHNAKKANIYHNDTEHSDQSQTSQANIPNGEQTDLKQNT